MLPPMDDLQEARGTETCESLCTIKVCAGFGVGGSSCPRVRSMFVVVVLATDTLSTEMSVVVVGIIAGQSIHRLADVGVTSWKVLLLRKTVTIHSILS